MGDVELIVDILLGGMVARVNLPGAYSTRFPRS
jgi:hypothetical protein